MATKTETRAAPAKAAGNGGDGGGAVALTTEQRIELARQQLEEQKLVAVSEGGIEIRSIADLMMAAKILHKSGLVPHGLDTPEAVGAGIWACMEARIPIMFGLRHSFVLNGRHAFWGEAVTAAMLSRGCKIRREFTGTEMADDWTCHVSLLLAGEDEWTEPETFSVADAKRAGLWAGGRTTAGKDADASNWATYPKDQLGWKALARAKRLHAAHLCAGMDMVEDIDDTPPVTARVRVMPRPAELDVEQEDDPLLAEALDAPEETSGSGASDEGENPEVEAPAGEGGRLFGRGD